MDKKRDKELIYEQKPSDVYMNNFAYKCYLCENGVPYGDKPSFLRMCAYLPDGTVASSEVSWCRHWKCICL